MKAVQGFAKLGLFFGMAIMLSACGGPPSDSEVNKLVASTIKNAFNEAKQDDGFGSYIAGAIKIDKVSSQGCESSSDNMYKCIVDITMTIRGEAEVKTEEFSLKKNSSGDWIVTDDWIN